MASSKVNPRALTKHLQSLGAEAHTMLDDGTPITREEALARLLWNMALGYTEKTLNDEGHWVETYHKPVAWAMQAVWDRREGKVPTAIGEDENRVKASDRVRDLAKARLNSLALAAAGPEKKGPPSYKPRSK